MRIAVAFTSIGPINEYELPPEVGQIVFQAYEWWVDDNLDYYESLTDLKTHICTEQELNLTGDANNDATFFKPHKDSLKPLSVASNKFLCIDND